MKIRKVSKRNIRWFIKANSERPINGDGCHSHFDQTANSRHKFSLKIFEGNKKPLKENSSEKEKKEPNKKGEKMNGGPSGFNNAHLTRAFVIACFVFSAFFGIKGLSSELGFSYQDIFARLRLWKLIASIFTFSSTPELLFGLYLLYYFRVFERQIGSNKYAVFILFSTIMSSLLEIVSLALLKDPTANRLTPGPYGVIFASFVPFFFDIPASTFFHVFGVCFSDKSFIYIAGFQLLFSSWKRSFLPGICGLLAGALYRVNLFGIRKAKLPEFVTSLFSRLSRPSGGSSRGASRRNVVGSSPYAGRPVERIYPSAAAMAPSIEPAEGSIAMLVAMGFDRHSARQALVQARNDINVATNILLEAQSH